MSPITVFSQEFTALSINKQTLKFTFQSTVPFPCLSITAAFAVNESHSVSRLADFDPLNRSTFLKVR